MGVVGCVPDHGAGACSYLLAATDGVFDQALSLLQYSKLDFDAWCSACAERVRLAGVVVVGTVCSCACHHAVHGFVLSAL